MLQCSLKQYIRCSRRRQWEYSRRITFKDIGQALAKGSIDAKVKDIMAVDLITIDSEASLIDAVKLFNAYAVGFIIVTYGGVPKSVLSKTDVLHELAVY